MAHIRVERLHPGDGQHHGAEGKEGGGLVLDKEAHRPDGVERPQYLGVVDDAAQPQHRQRHKPDQHDGGKQLAHHGSAMFLNGKQQSQHQHRERHDIRVQRRRHQAQPLDSRHHRHRRGDHHLAIEEAATDQAEDDQQRRPAGGGVTGRQRHQGENAPFTGVICPHHKGEVLDRYHQDQQPDDQREETENGGWLDAEPELT